MENRYDMYRNVHKGLRRELGSLLALVGATDPTHERAVARLQQQFTTTFSLLDAHHHHEDAHIGPHLRLIAPLLFEQMEREHAGFDAECAVLGEQARGLSVVSRSRAEAALGAFYLGLSTFVARYFLHMHAEEIEYNQALQLRYSDAELEAIETALVQSIEPGLFGQFLSVMLPAMNTPEREGLLLGARAGAPASVFAGLCELAQGVLPAEAWTTLAGRLAVGNSGEAAHA